MSEILFETAEECDCCTGDARWSRAFYAMDEAEAEAWLVGDTDGNWDSCEEAPGSEEIAASWDRYAEYVAETGSDPLGDYYVSRKYKRREVWVALYVQTLAAGRPDGCCVGVIERRAGERPPADVLAYFLAGAQVQSGRELRHAEIGWEYVSGLTPSEGLGIISVTRPNNLTVRVRAAIERTVPRKPSAIARDLRQAAKRRLRMSRKAAGGRREDREASLGIGRGCEE